MKAAQEFSEDTRNDITKKRGPGWSALLHL